MEEKIGTKLDLAIAEQDIDNTLLVIEKMLESIEDNCFKTIGAEDVFGYLKGNKKWQEIKNNNLK